MQPCIPLLHSYNFTSQKAKLTASVPGLATIGHAAAHTDILALHPTISISVVYLTAN